MFLRRPNSLLYLARSALKFYADDFSQGAELSIPHNIVNDLEIVDQDKLGGQIAAFIAEHKLKPAMAAIVLSEDVLFTKLVGLDSAAREKEIREFLEAVPFGHNELVYQLKPESKGLLVIAANSALYLAIKNILETNGWRIKMIVPDIGGIFGAADWREVLNRTLKLKRYDFLNKKNVSKLN